jgi:hypothetical protein
MFRVLIRILVVLINIFYFKLVIIMIKLVLVHIYQCLITYYYFKIIDIISELLLSYPLSSIQPNRTMVHPIHPTNTCIMDILIPISMDRHITSNFVIESNAPHMMFFLLKKHVVTLLVKPILWFLFLWISYAHLNIIAYKFPMFSIPMFCTCNPTKFLYFFYSCIFPFLPFQRGP